MKFKFMESHRNAFSIKTMCQVFKVSRSGFYAWHKKPESSRDQEDKRLGILIKTSFDQSRMTYGYRRVQKDLQAQQETVGKHRIIRLMKLLGLQPKTRKKFTVTTDSRHDKPIYDNKLQRQFNPLHPNQRWVSDITYIPTTEGWLYLAAVMDLYSRKIIGWSMSSRMKDSLVMDALKMALFRRGTHSSLLLHSDRGSQYASDNFQQLLQEHRIECSMSGKGDCWDNAVMESFFHSMKTECIHHERFQTRDEAKKVVFDYIEVFYNQQRRHSYLNYQSPVQYEIVNAVI